ncbi:MAG: type II toxin-antitoxin system PemK/MazF family toxin [Burkholderiales bacterium]|nr:type II toxin-antitoxin system PemK/MazF family toxin [Burkholderiales bacterium]
MAATSRFSFGDVVLVPFPFTDQSGTKKRPAVVVSSQGYNANRRDIVIMAITSQVRTPLGFGESMVADWQGAGLVKESVLKPVFTTIEQGLVIRVMGHLSAVSQRMVANYESPAATPPANLRPQIAAALGVWIAERFGVGAKVPLVKHDGDGRLRRRLPVIVKLDAAAKRQVPQVFRRSMLSSHAGS